MRASSYRCQKHANALRIAQTIHSMSMNELMLRLFAGTEPFYPLRPGSRKPPSGFAIIRPPGHHAVPVGPMGFCLFGNIAVAARHAQNAHGLRRVMIVDYDVHHGNGTNDIFYEDPDVLFLSTHQQYSYPGTGEGC